MGIRRLGETICIRISKNSPERQKARTMQDNGQILQETLFYSLSNISKGYLHSRCHFITTEWIDAFVGSTNDLKNTSFTKHPL